MLGSKLSILVYHVVSLYDMLIYKFIIKIMEKQIILALHYLYFYGKLSFSRLYLSLGVIYVGIFLMLKKILCIFGCCIKKWFGI